MQTLAKTDLPVPRPPVITTPPNPDLLPPQRASLSVPWPVMAARGVRVAWSSLTLPLATMEAFNLIF